MAHAFSCTFDLSSYKKFIKFVPDTGGVEYLLTHELTWTIYGNSILNVAVECNSCKDGLVTSELFSAGSHTTFKSSSLFNDCRAALNFQNVNFLTADPWRCVVTIVPHLHLRDLRQEATSSTSSSLLVPGRMATVQRSKLEQLSADMQNILTSGDLSDVTLTDGVNTIRAHKVVLSARSPVFAKMFLHPMKENSENSVTISDIPDDALRELVSFIYTGKVTLKDGKMARNLYIAADKYAVADLKKLCSEIMQCLSVEDVLDTLALADLFEDKTLKQSALDFISRNYSQMKNSKDWEDFMKENQALAIEILSFVIENKI